MTSAAGDQRPPLLVSWSRLLQRVGCVLLLCMPISNAFAAGSGDKAAGDVRRQRLIVLTDIEADPDDAQSLVRLLLYSNEIDLEALVATTSTHMRGSIHPESIRRIVEAYGKVQPNLALHASGYPKAEDLVARIASGQPGYGMAHVGAGHDSVGSRAIVSALLRPDPRPLWVAAWGGTNTLAQALQALRGSRSPQELTRLLAKLRVHAISDQDDSGAWLRREFPGLFYIVSPGSYAVATWGGINLTVDGIDNSNVGNAWIAANLQQGKGPLGAAYPDVAYGMEGDTPSFLGLIPTGLADPEHPDWGGWGGRYVLRTPAFEELDAGGFNGNVVVEPERRPIWTNATDTIRPVIDNAYGPAHLAGKRSFTGNRETLWRWRDAFQNDFAARMAWSTQSYDEANHPPVVALDHPQQITVRAGEVFVLGASGSTDPDGDSLSYFWFHYPEIGDWPETIATLGAANMARVVARAPEVTTPRIAHFIVQVTDKGTPQLTRYARVQVRIVPR